MLQGFFVLVLFWWLGEGLKWALDIPIPGAILGMLCLFGFLMVRRGPSQALEQTSDGLLRHLALLFVAPGVGIIVHLGLLRTEGLGILAMLVLSALITFCCTALLAQWLLGRGSKP